MPDIALQEVETRDNPDIAIIWLHGLGADGSDFVPIVDELDLGDEFAIRFIFPDAPQRPVSCNGGYVMRAWYDIISLEASSRKIDEAGLIESIGIVQKLIKREVDRGIPSQRIFLAGFSQGGAVAYSAALMHPAPLAGIVALSTYIPSARLISENLSAANRQIPIFAAHGLADSVVSPALGQQAIALIESHGYTPEWHGYAMAHEVCQEEITAIGQWLRRRITTLAPQPALRQDYASVPAYRTKDGSEIRELMHPEIHGNAAQSLAEATLQPGGHTQKHRHRLSEEIYHVTAGHGLMTLADQQFAIAPGDTVLIPPGTAHCLTNTGETPLRILCCCSPAYNHADTELLENDAGSNP